MLLPALLRSTQRLKWNAGKKKNAVRRLGDSSA
jgi:hypothetical protein